MANAIVEIVILCVAWGVFGYLYHRLARRHRLNIWSAVLIGHAGGIGIFVTYVLSVSRSELSLLELIVVAEAGAAVLAALVLVFQTSRRTTKNSQ